ncbi:unnamed protein product [Parajaminaea phylloscopi]
MVAHVATSPTLRAYPHEGIVPQLSQSPPSRNGLPSLIASVGRATLADGSFASGHRPQQPPHKYVLPRGHDSADLEAVRQQRAADLAEEAALVAHMAVHPGSTSVAQAASSEGQAANVAASESDLIDADPQGPFEGPEKLLELWFADCPEMLPSSTLTASFSILQDDRGQPLPTASPKHRAGLRAAPRPAWEEMLDLVHCKVLSVVEGDHFDAYLLSESSMFVFPHKIILKTCGTTTLLLGLQRILDLAKAVFSGSSDFPTGASGHTAECPPAAEASLSTRAAHCESPRLLGSLVRQCFYSRKSFMFPERQKGPHRDWQLEVQLLDSFFADGSAYTVGKTNGDHWLLYMCCPGDKEDEARRLEATATAIERPLHLPDPGCVDAASDQTLEILMTHLSPSSCSQFEFPADMPLPAAANTAAGVALDRGHLLGMDLSTKLGLTDLYPNTDLDAFAFEPCGYSANAVIPASKGCSAGYWTVHVTPEHDSSYASFESNIRLPKTHQAAAGTGIGGLIGKVVAIFQPGKLSITLFTSRRDEDDTVEYDADGNALQDDVDVLNRLKLPGFTRRDRIGYEFESYDLVFLHFEASSLVKTALGRKASS